MSICDQALDLCSAVLHTRTMTNAHTAAAAYVSAPHVATLTGLAQQEVEAAYENGFEDWNVFTVGSAATLAEIHELTVTPAELRRVVASMRDLISDLQAGQ